MINMKNIRHALMACALVIALPALAAADEPAAKKESRIVVVHDDDARAGVVELAGDRPADSPGGAGHQGFLSGQVKQREVGHLQLLAANKCNVEGEFSSVRDVAARLPTVMLLQLLPSRNHACRPGRYKRRIKRRKMLSDAPVTSRSVASNGDDLNRR